MARKKKQPTIDADNPEWTKEDFARAKPAEEVLPAAVLSGFKQYRGPQKAPKKVFVSIRLSPVVVAHFKRKGPGWQTRIDEVLTKHAKRAGTVSRARSGSPGRGKSKVA